MMFVKSLRRLVMSAGLWVAFVPVAAMPVAAQDTPAAAPLAPPVIAVVDVDQVFQESTAAKSVRTQADKYQQTFQDQIRKEESTLRSTQQEIDQERKTLSPEAFTEKARAFDNSVAEFQRKGLARRRAFDRSFSAAMGQVQQVMLDVTKQVASARGATMVLPRTQVMLFDDKMNITKDIIVAMDMKLPHVDFPPPKVEVEAGGETPGAAAATKRKPQ